MRIGIAIDVLRRGGGAGNAGAAALADAVLWLDASRSVAAEQTMVNGGSGSAALNAVYGTGTGVDASDPLLLTHTGTNYLYLPGVAALNNNASIPDPAWLAGATELDVRVAVAMDDWTPAATSVLAAQGTTAAAVSSFRFYITTAGALNIEAVDGATAFISALSSSANLAATPDGGLLVVRVTFRGSDGRVQFFSKTTTEATATADTAAHTGWTQLGTDKSVAVTALTNSTNTLAFGGYSSTSSNALGGKVYAAWVATTIGGTAQANINFTTNTSHTSFTESSANAATVTITRTTTGRKAVMVTRPVILFGTDDYLEVADNDLLDFDASASFTVLMVLRQWPTFGASAYMMKKTAFGATDPGWGVRGNAASATTWRTAINDGTTNINKDAAAATMGALHLTGMIVNRTAQTVAGVLNSAVTATSDVSAVGSLATAEVLRIGRYSGATTPGYSDFELLAVAVWRRALSAGEIAAVATYYGA